MNTRIIKEEEYHMWIQEGDTLEILHNDKVILTHTFKECDEIRYIGVFEIVGGGFGGYFSKESQKKYWRFL